MMFERFAASYIVREDVNRKKVEKPQIAHSVTEDLKRQKE